MYLDKYHIFGLYYNFYATFKFLNTFKFLASFKFLGYFQIFNATLKILGYFPFWATFHFGLLPYIWATFKFVINQFASHLSKYVGGSANTRHPTLIAKTAYLTNKLVFLDIKCTDMFRKERNGTPIAAENSS